MITDEGVMDAPDLVVEILSPNTAKYDRDGKMKTYKRNQVSKYWILDPKAQSIEVYSWKNEDYDLLGYAVGEGKVESQVLKRIELLATSVFEQS